MPLLDSMNMDALCGVCCVYVQFESCDTHQ